MQRLNIFSQQCFILHHPGHALFRHRVMTTPLTRPVPHANTQKGPFTPRGRPMRHPGFFGFTST